MAVRIKAVHPVAFGDAFAAAQKASVITGNGEIRPCGMVLVDWIGS
jgi:hypothetical protein